MQSLKKFYFGKQKAKVNTYIGGIGATINTPALLAAKLGIAENRIKLFKVTGVDVECAVVGGGQFSFYFSDQIALNGITYYYDNDGYVNNIQSSGLRGGLNFFKGYFPGIINQIGTLVFQDKPIGYKIEMPNCISLPSYFTGNYSGVIGKVLIVPKCINFGIDKLNNSVFTSGGGAQGLKVYAPASEQTSNAGSVEGDLAYVQSVGSQVIFVTNFTPPNAITNLSSGTIYNTAIQLNFTPPTSVNGVDFYEVYINGEKFNSKEIKNSGDFITGLTPNTAYKIEVKAVDMFYNKSSFSNAVNVTTTNRVATDVDAIAYINASSNTLFQDVIDDAFKGLKTQGLYNKIQAFYPFLGTTQAQHKWNGKNPQDTNAAFRLQFFGGGTHSNLGYQCNGTNAYANTFLAPSAVQNVNSNGLTVTVGTNNTTSQNDVVEIGSFVSVTQASLVVAKSNNTNFSRFTRMNGNSINQINQNDAKGIFTSIKQSATVTKLIRNSIEIANGNRGGTLPNINLFIGTLNINGSTYGAGFSNQRIQFTAIHEGLTDAEVVALHTIIDNFEAAIGRKTW